MMALHVRTDFWTNGFILKYEKRYHKRGLVQGLIPLPSGIILGLGSVPSTSILLGFPYPTKVGRKRKHRVFGFHKA